jgi:hypothetical protein
MTMQSRLVGVCSKWKMQFVGGVLKGLAAELRPMGVKFKGSRFVGNIDPYFGRMPDSQGNGSVRHVYKSCMTLR